MIHVKSCIGVFKMAQGNGKKPFYKRIWVWVIVALIVIGFAGGGSNSDSNKSSKASSSASSASTVKKDKSLSSSVKKAESYDYSKVEYGMTMDEVINAVSSQPTDRDDSTMFFGKDEFDFNDNKLIGSSVKTVQDKIDAKFKADQSSEKKQRKEQKEQKFTNAINTKIDSINQATQNSNGIDAIQGIDHPYDNTYKIQLDSFFLSGTDLQIKSAVNSINSQFIEIFEDNGKPSPTIRYEVDGTEIAKNKILNPSEVKLEK